MSRSVGNSPSFNPAQQADESERTMPLMSGVARADEAISGAELATDGSSSGSNVLSQGTLLVLLAFVVAAGALMLMRQQRADPDADVAGKEVEAKIEEALAKLSKPNAMAQNDSLRQENINALFKDTGSIIAMFNVDVTSQQVPLEFLKKNPFSVPARAQVEMAAPAAVNTDGQREKRLRELHAEAKELDLQSIMEGSRPVAIIGGTLVQQGQTIGSFQVAKIGGMGVTLTADGQEFKITMQKNPDEAERRKR
jgi:hypothetical protein